MGLIGDFLMTTIDEMFKKITFLKKKFVNFLLCQKKVVSL